MKYRLFASKCNACHTLARPINSQYVELNPDELAAAKKKEPGLFKSPKIWQVESRIWERYVKRMIKKPEWPVRGENGKKSMSFSRMILKFAKREPVETPGKRTGKNY